MNTSTQIYFAPFQGITTHTFRKVYANHFDGVDKLFTPYFSNIATNHSLPSKKAIALSNSIENGIAVIPQILSKEAEEIVGFAQHCQKLGFKELNWNLGCPYPQVANKKRGSGMLPYPDLVAKILDRVFSEIQIPFSIKCRLGYFSVDELEKLIPIFNRFPIHELTIHARTGRQLYSGYSNLDEFARYAPQIDIPVAYNGDIFSLGDYRRFETQFPEINRIMLGRGILYDPFLPAKIKGTQLPQNHKAKLNQFIDDLYYAYRKEKNDHLTLLNILKEFWTYLSNSFEEPTKVFRRLKKIKNFDEYEDAVKEVFQEFTLK
jgi:tRNA-dihydrouridine synthase